MTKLALVACVGGCSAFNVHTLPIIDVLPSSRISYAEKACNDPAYIPLPHSTSRQSIKLLARQLLDDSEDSSHTHVDTSRRAMFQQCASIFATSVSALALNQQQVANAAEFSDGFEPMEEVASPTPKDAPPRFSDETVITPIRPQVMQQDTPESTTVSSNAPVAKQVTLENSQVVTIPTEQVQVSNPKFSSEVTADATYQPHVLTPKERRNSVPAEFGMTAVVLGGIATVLLGRVEPNTDDLTAKAKVVMVTNEPYGLDGGRRFYNGIDITINDPIPASDVLNNCDAGQVNNDCTKTITGFLDDIQNSSKNDDGPSESQQETATAVLSYLDSMSSSSKSAPAPYSVGNNSGNSDATSNTAAAFSSYLNGLSNGEINAPSSPQMVSDYLNSLNEVQSRMNELETSVKQLPNEMTGRLQSFQEQQDEKLALEFVKIEEYLIKKESDTCGYDDVPRVDMNGYIEAVNGVESQWN